MMNKLTAVLLTLLSLIGSSLSARQLSVTEAIARMRSESGKNMRRVSGTNTLSLEYTEMVGDSAVLYVVNGSNGFYVLSADDCAPAVLGWTDSGKLNKDSIPENLRWWMSQYAAGISRASATGTPIKVAQRGTAVGPLMTSIWRQEEPYNNLCTDLGSACLTGCVATAMGQIMNYYKYPAQGNGSHSYTYSNVEISSNFSEHTYNWDKILDQYNYWGNDSASESAVALLMRDCGVSIDMQYSTYGSGASNNMVAYALQTYFGYDKGMRNVYRAYVSSDSVWEDMIIEELQAGRPVMYSGSSNETGGHCFVCDGYDGEGYFHINWGWGGGCDGNFLLAGTDALNPYKNGNADECYTGGQMILIGIQPNKGGQAAPGGLGMPQGFTLSSSTADRSSYTYLSSNYMFNMGTAPLTASLGLMFKNGDDVYYCASPYQAGTYALDGYYMPSYIVYLSGVMKNGTYEVYPVFKDANNPSLGWQQIALPDTFSVPTFTVTGTEPTACLDGYATVWSHGKHTKNNKVLADNISFKVPLKAIQDWDNVYFTAYVYAVGDDGTQTYKCAMYSDDLTATAGDKVVVTFTPSSYTTFTTGKHYILVKSGYTSMKPDDYNTVYFYVVDHMPTISDVPATVKKALDGEATVTDVQTMAEDVVTTETAE